MGKKASAAGSFLGGIANNPGIVILGLVLGGLIIFRDRISEAVGSIPGAVAGGIGDIQINLPDIKFPEFKFPDFKFPEFPEFKFPEIKFPELSLPELPPLFVDDPKDSAVNIPDPLDQNLSPGLAGGIQQRQRDLRDSLNLTPAQEFAAEKSGISGTQQLIDFLGLEFAPPAAAESAPVLPPDTNPFGFDDTVLNTIGTEQQFTGGGVGFQGGAINPTPITTLTQVLDLFPGIRASQAADFLGENRGILPEAALLQGFDVRNISEAPGDPPQRFDQSSEGTVGIGANELFKLLFPNIISNF